MPANGAHQLKIKKPQKKNTVEELPPIKRIPTNKEVLSNGPILLEKVTYPPNSKAKPKI